MSDPAGMRGRGRSRHTSPGADVRAEPEPQALQALRAELARADEEVAAALTMHDEAPEDARAPLAATLREARRDRVALLSAVAAAETAERARSDAMFNSQLRSTTADDGRAEEAELARITAEELLRSRGDAAEPWRRDLRTEEKRIANFLASNASSVDALRMRVSRGARDGTFPPAAVFLADTLLDAATAPDRAGENARIAVDRLLVAGGAVDAEAVRMSLWRVVAEAPEAEQAELGPLVATLARAGVPLLRGTDPVALEINRASIEMARSTMGPGGSSGGRTQPRFWAARATVGGEPHLYVEQSENGPRIDGAPIADALAEARNRAQTMERELSRLRAEVKRMGRGNGSAQTRVCFNCGQPGHISRECNQPVQQHGNQRVPYAQQRVPYAQRFGRGARGAGGDDAFEELPPQNQQKPPSLQMMQQQKPPSMQPLNQQKPGF